MKDTADCGWIALCLNELRNLAQRGAFDVLLTCGPDRLARTSSFQALIIEELEQCGVKTIFPDRGAADDPQSRQHQVTETVAEFSRRG